MLATKGTRLMPKWFIRFDGRPRGAIGTFYRLNVMETMLTKPTHDQAIELITRLGYETHHIVSIESAKKG